jgi:hypothetical protein
VRRPPSLHPCFKPTDMYLGTYSAGRFVPNPLSCLHYSHEEQRLIDLIPVRNAPVFMDVCKRPHALLAVFETDSPLPPPVS